jgi:glutaminyl-tRNA synthetase
MVVITMLSSYYNYYHHATSLPFASGFAYAPNFITKIIAQSTGKEPVGLLEIPPVSNSNTDEINSEITVTSPITTRFPPEPNGYLHLGHAKAVSFNFAVARMFPPDGKCHMRLDDTNPSKENQEYIDSILEDVRWIQSGTPAFPNNPKDEHNPENNGPWFGKVHKTSDSFDLIYECTKALIQSGDAYVDSLTAEEMREYRGTLTEPGKDSPYRNRSIEENLQMFEEMRAGKYKDGEHIVRAKIDMSSSNINMRDPTLYRIKHESHPCTGDKWCIYPMYDYSHPIQDSVEGITHSLCTLEFEDHRPFYDWTLDKLIPTGLITARPRQIEFSRLNLKYTVLSKRKLIQLVEGNHVNGWDDPRMPTLSGIRRRGAAPEAMRLFCERVGISKVDSFIDVGDLENCIREVMDDTSQRAFAILNPLRVTITNWEGSELEEFQVPRHPKKDELGTRTVPFGKDIYMERSDFFDLDGPEGQANGGRKPKGFKRLLPNDKVRLKYAYVIQCDEIVRDDITQEPIELKCSYIKETRAGVTPEGMSRVNGIIQWVEASTAVPCQINQYDRLFNVEEPGKETGNFLDDINKDSLLVLDQCFVEPSVANDAKEIMKRIEMSKESFESSVSVLRTYHSELAYQFERSGYFALDSDTSPEKLIFNRVVTLRDTWSIGKDNASSSSLNLKSEGTRTRGVQSKDGANDGSKKNSNLPLEDVLRVSLRAGTILEATTHPDADTLWVFKVDVGDDNGEYRTVVTGLGGRYENDAKKSNEVLSSLLGRKVAFVTNLKPAKMRGIESFAMILAASNDDKVELLDVPKDVPNGELLCFDGKGMSQPDDMMKSKGALKAFDRFKECLYVNEDGNVVYRSDDKDYNLISSGGNVMVSSLKNVSVQ